MAASPSSSSSSSSSDPPVFAFHAIAPFPSLALAAARTTSAQVFGAGAPGVVVHFFNGG